MEEIVKAIKQIPGFKLSNSHFLIGSKIHLKDFYFAKRLFQNSFFASKFAFLIAKHIIEVHQNVFDKYIQIIRQRKKLKSKDGITLIGYGLYSELLVSLVEYFLKKKHKDLAELINHNIVDDIEEVKLIKSYENNHKDVILIIPISSTFSTSIKIEEFCKKKESEVLTPHISVILVSDGNLTNIVTDLPKKFGWEKIDINTRTIEVNAFYENKILDAKTDKKKSKLKSQKYFLAIPSKWFDINNCALCFPNIPLKEIPLHFTDKTSVTPALIYDIPQGRIIEKESLERKLSISPETLENKHLKRDGTHYHYYIYVERFFVENKERVEEWLLNDIKEKINYKDTEYAVIVAPGHFSNAGFVNVVNELLFNNSANILHYDPRKDDIQNFQLFYKDEVGNANKIYFVDDTITTGSTFTSANYFVKHTREVNENKFHPGFDACIILLDRASRFVHRNVLRKLPLKENGELSDKLFSYANLHLPSLNSNYTQCPLCKDKERYDELVQNSFLDRLKVHFIKESTKVKPKNITEITYQQGNAAKSLRVKFGDENRYLKRIEAIHRIYQWFIKNNIPDKEETFSNWVEKMLNETYHPFSTQFLNANGKNAFETRASILKVLTQPPFLDYQPLRKKTFDWVIQLLDAHIKNFTQEINNLIFNYQSFKYLKFLIRRAGMLNSNYLISENMLALIKILYDNLAPYKIYKTEFKIISKNIDQTYQDINNINNEIGQINLNTSENGEMNLFNDEKEIGKQNTELLKKNEELEKYKYRIKDIINNIQDFNVYYAAQVKELLFLNEARSVNIERKILKFQNEDGNSLPFIQFLRILREENGILIQQFWEFIKKSSKWNKKNIYEDTAVINEKIKEILKEGSIKLHYKYDTLKEFFNTSLPEELCENIPFVNYLWLKNFFLIENNEEPVNILESYDNNAIGEREINNNNKKDKITLSQKTDSIIERLKNIVFDNNKNIGAFFIVEYNPESSDPYFLAYNRGKSDGTIEKFKDNEFICRFIEGEDDNTGQADSKKTIIEFHRTGEKPAEYKWLDLYSNKKDTYAKGISRDFISENFNRLLLVRVNKKLYDDKKDKIVETSKGVIGFYFNKDNQEITDINKTRYLLLLREDISSFIHKHHENNEFWEWREANIRNKLSLLTGHGRGMLLNIASNYSNYRPIVDTMLHVQQFVLNYADEKRINKETKSDKSVTLTLFNNYYAPKRDVSDSKINLISEIFNRDVTNSKINLISEIFNLTRDIYLKFKEIEKIEKAIDIYINNKKVNNFRKFFKKDITIHYYGVVIKLIFFELLVNAKKNRWHFNVQNVPGYKNNVIWIDWRQTDESLIVGVSNTGPFVPKEIIDELNNPAIISIKEDGDDVAGLALIKTILLTFNLGSIYFSNNNYALEETTGLGKFTTTITFDSRHLFPQKNKE